MVIRVEILVARSALAFGEKCRYDVDYTAYIPCCYTFHLGVGSYESLSKA